MRCEGYRICGIYTRYRYSHPLLELAFVFCLNVLYIFFAIFLMVYIVNIYSLLTKDFQIVQTQKRNFTVDPTFFT